MQLNSLTYQHPLANSYLFLSFGEHIRLSMGQASGQGLRLCCTGRGGAANSRSRAMRCSYCPICWLMALHMHSNRMADQGHSRWLRWTARTSKAVLSQWHSLCDYNSTHHRGQPTLLAVEPGSHSGPSLAGIRAGWCLMSFTSLLLPDQSEPLSTGYCTACS